MPVLLDRDAVDTAVDNRGLCDRRGSSSGGRADRHRRLVTVAAAAVDHVNGVDVAAGPGVGSGHRQVHRRYRRRNSKLLHIGRHRIPAEAAVLSIDAIHVAVGPAGKRHRP